jgi:hypothetical protein
MRPVPVILFCISISLPGSGRAQESCSWFDAATAGGVLGGTVHMSISGASDKKDDGDCVFSRRQQSLTDELRIEVRTMTDPKSGFASYARRCRNRGTPLKGIGNEATACDVAAKSGHVEQVVGRVRNRAFVVRLKIDDPSSSQSSVREKARMVAEQVAGSLF